MSGAFPKMNRPQEPCLVERILLNKFSPGSAAITRICGCDVENPVIYPVWGPYKEVQGVTHVAHIGSLSAKPVCRGRRRSNTFLLVLFELL